MTDDNSCVIIAKLGGVVHLGGNDTILSNLSILSDHSVLAFKVHKTCDEYHIHLKTFYGFTMEFDGQEHILNKNEELMLVVYLQDNQ